MKKITISDVASEANVSKSTVSQYLNNRFEYMSEDTRQKIQDAIETLNYRPNIVARSLKQKSTKTVGVIVANIVHSFSTQVINELEINLHKHGFHMIVCNSNDQPEKEREHIEVLISKQVDGIIVFPTTGNIDLFEKLYKQHFPIIFIDRKIDSLPIPSVLLDNKLASKLAVDAFVEKGYRNIAFITNAIDQPITPRVERLQGFKEAMESYGLSVSKGHLNAVPVNRIQQRLSELFNEVQPDGILVANDRVLIELLRFVKQKGIKIPSDIGIIGIDEVPFASFFDPPICTIEQPFQQIALQAATILVEKIQSQNKSYQEIYRFLPKLNDRDSY
ncbi:LacI family DNA-binding transcriptional regulator [Ureibacillus composti]